MPDSPRPSGLARITTVLAATGDLGVPLSWNAGAFYAYAAHGLAFVALLARSSCLTSRRQWSVRLLTITTCLAAIGFFAQESGGETVWQRVLTVSFAPPGPTRTSASDEVAGPGASTEDFPAVFNRRSCQEGIFRDGLGVHHPPRQRPVQS
jgi:hypothetical protein